MKKSRTCRDFFRNNLFMKLAPLTSTGRYLGFLCAAFLLSIGFLSGNFSFEEDGSALTSQDPVRFELVSEETTVKPGRPFWVALHLDIDDHWHAYWKHPGDIGMPTRVEWVLPEGYTISDLEWPFPQKFEQNGFVGFGFENSITLLAEITPPKTAKEGDKVPIEANIRWLVCSEESCLPGETAVTVEMSVSEAEPVAIAEKNFFFKEARNRLPQTAWNASAESSNGLMTLKIQPPGQKVLTSAYFCPAEKEMIDPKAETSLVPDIEHPGIYTLTLKMHDKGSPTALKGVLVVEAKGRLEAVDLNIPLKPEPSLIGMADNGGGFRLASVSTVTDMPHLPPESMEFDGGVGLALFFAFIGGIILNLMPCVLPVVSFKVLSFVKMAGQSRNLILKHGLAFSGGVLLSFWALAGLMLALQSYGQSVGWGFQLQEPLFVGGLAALLLVFALSLFGVFEMGTSVTAWAGQMDTKSRSSELAGSFFSGVLATAVATPCTGPFLGTAIGFAVTLPTFWALLIFTSLGLGMASPYLLLAAFPSLLRFMPKPGAWMNTFKEILGFVMLATVLWLVWVFAAQTGTLSIFLLLLAFFILAVGAWIYGRWGSVANKKGVRFVSISLALCSLGLAGYTLALSTSPALVALEESTSSQQGDGWETFSPERIAELQAAGVPVLVDFTAKWCLICQANHLVLSVDEVERTIQKMGVVKMKADWTKNDPVITQALKQFGRSGVPLYVLYGNEPMAQPTILPQVLTPDLVVDELNKLDPSIAER